MITAIDTNILLDVFSVDAEFATASAALLRKALREGAVVASPVVWAETATFFSESSSFLQAMQTLSIEFSPLTESSALLAAEMWREYRANGGKKNRLLADFLIAAHAITTCDRLLTRDRGFYKNYFKNLNIIEPNCEL